MSRVALRLAAFGLATLALAPLAGGCSAGVEDEQSHRSAIAGGIESGPEDGAVVFLSTLTASCSGVLLAPNLVVTTAYCVSFGGLAFNFRCSPEGELENGGSGAGEIGNAHEPAGIAVRNSVQPLGTEPVAFGQHVLTTGTTAICRNDLAFVVLDRALNDAPILPVRLSAPVRVGETFTAIGYGTAEPGAGSIRRRRRPGMAVLESGAPPRTFTAGPGPCAADSGGPALSETTGAVFGVFSVLHATCGSELSGSVYTELAPFRDLAQQAFEAAGAEPWIEEPGSTSEPATDTTGGCAVTPPRTRPDAATLVAFASLALTTQCARLARRRRARVVAASN